MNLEDLVLLKMASFFSEEDVEQAFSDAQEELSASSVKLASEDAERLALRDMVMHKLAASFEDDELQSVIAESEVIHDELIKKADNGQEAFDQFAKAFQQMKEREDKISANPLVRGVNIAGNLARLGTFGHSAYKGYQSASQGEESDYKEHMKRKGLVGGAHSALYHVARGIASDDPAGVIGTGFTGGVGSAAGAVGGAISHGLGRAAGHVARGLGASGEKKTEKQGSAELTPEQVVILSEQLGPQKVAQLIEQVEQEKIAAYHYNLGHLMGEGFADRIEKQAMTANVPAVIPQGPMMNTSSPGRSGISAKHVGAGLLAAGAGVAAKKLYDRSKEKEVKASDDLIYQALGILDSAGFDISKLAQDEKKLKKAVKEGVQEAEDEEDEEEAKEEVTEAKEELKKAKEEAKKEASVYRSLATLERMGFDTSKLAKKELPEELKNNKYPQDKDEDGKVDESEDDEDKATKKEKEEAEKKASLFRALAVCAENGIHFQG